jgi:bacillithiol biosynthesis cysteine-adding enzyme BshC
MFAVQHLSYQQTRAFSDIVTDYVSAQQQLRGFYRHPVSIDGVKAAIHERMKFNTQRQVLVEVLQEQYKSVAHHNMVADNIQSLLAANTFTVTTAHQPNLLTGPLYFIYKIVHAVKMAESLNQQLPEYHFVPVFYMGSEDADIHELNHFTVQDKKYIWQTKQKGAVGRMLVDNDLIQLIEELKGQLGIEPSGIEVTELFSACFQKGKSIQAATFELINALFASYGLIVLIADDARLKHQLSHVFSDDLLQHQPNAIVSSTCDLLEEHYRVQAHPRLINLFYLKDDIRERIEKVGAEYHVVNTNIRFTEAEISGLLMQHPECFSPNVILRGLYQETILPNIAFIGGGGELAYWLQLEDLFTHYQVPYPVLVLRNSFLIIEDKWKKKLDRLGLQITDLFQPENDILQLIVKRYAADKLSLVGYYNDVDSIYSNIETQAVEVDASLERYVQAIKKRSLKTLKALEKKMIRAEKRRYSDEQRQIAQICAALFPKNGLQERVENFSRFYVKWGNDFIHHIYHHSLTLDQQFTVMSEK